ncbi:MAG: hypothetical protein AAGJ35_13645, partial [Myxococcota bacterium]
AKQRAKIAPHNRQRPQTPAPQTLSKESARVQTPPPQSQVTSAQARRVLRETSYAPEENQRREESRLNPKTVVEGRRERAEKSRSVSETTMAKEPRKALQERSSVSSQVASVQHLEHSEDVLGSSEEILRFSSRESEAAPSAEHSSPVSDRTQIPSAQELSSAFLDVIQKDAVLPSTQADSAPELSIDMEDAEQNVTSEDRVLALAKIRKIQKTSAELTPVLSPALRKNLDKVTAVFVRLMESSPLTMFLKVHTFQRFLQRNLQSYVVSSELDMGQLWAQLIKLPSMQKSVLEAYFSEVFRQDLPLPLRVPAHLRHLQPEINPYANKQQGGGFRGMLSSLEDELGDFDLDNISVVQTAQDKFRYDSVNQKPEPRAPRRQGPQDLQAQM